MKLPGLLFFLSGFSCAIAILLINDKNMHPCWAMFSISAFLATGSLFSYLDKASRK